MSKTLSNIEYLIATARVIVEDKQKFKRELSVCSDKERDALRSAWRNIAFGKIVTINSVERVANSRGMSISEAFLLPGTFTDWYIDSDKKYFAENMKKFRLENDLTQLDLAKMAGLKKYVYGLYERKSTVPSVLVMQRIADALGVEIADMFLLS